MIDPVGIVLAGTAVGLLQGGAVLGLGAAFRLMRFPDITVEGSFLIGAAIWVSLATSGWSPAIAILATVIAGSLCGISTASLHELLGLDRFLAGILVTASCYSIALLVLGASNIGLYSAPSPFGSLLDLESHPLTAGSLAAFAAALSLYLFFASPAGLRARAASSNPQMFVKTVGRTFPYVAAGLGFTNGVVALAGAAFARYQGFVDISMGQGILITALAALAIGEAVTRWVRLAPTLAVIASALLGSILYQWALSTALSLGFPAATTKLVTAGIVILFLTIQVRSRSQRQDLLAL